MGPTEQTEQPGTDHAVGILHTLGKEGTRPIAESFLVAAPDCRVDHIVMVPPHGAYQVQGLARPQHLLGQLDTDDVRHHAGIQGVLLCPESFIDIGDGVVCFDKKVAKGVDQGAFIHPLCHHQIERLRHLGQNVAHHGLDQRVTVAAEAVDGTHESASLLPFALCSQGRQHLQPMQWLKRPHKKPPQSQTPVRTGQLILQHGQQTIILGKPGLQRPVEALGHQANGGVSQPRVHKCPQLPVDLTQGPQPCLDKIPHTGTHSCRRVDHDAALLVESYVAAINALQHKHKITQQRRLRYLLPCI
eukprot:comp12597_c0_seq1/m.7620 comp12597_c0_seq1/g.7620  ORF comp12597_c0_seq1/g.7620 comp12597_c0_seq1/m.7620 type:complete len:302 (+) comp12597_c0_seq1:1304-2209(+)